MAIRDGQVLVMNDRNCPDLYGGIATSFQAEWREATIGDVGTALICTEGLRLKADIFPSALPVQQLRRNCPDLYGGIAIAPFCCPKGAEA